MSKLVAVQALRGLAALAVAALHAQGDAQVLAARAGLAFVPALQLPWAAGVDAFFVISGLIMVHASRTLFAAPGARARFLARRIARIVPLYWAVTLLYVAVALAAPGLVNSPGLSPSSLAASLLFIPYRAPDGLFHPVYSLGWTLNYEMAFYALFAVALASPRRVAVPALIAAIAGLAALGRVVAFPEPLGFWSRPIILEFAFGLAIGFARSEGITLPGPARATLAALGAALLCLPGADPESVSTAARPFVWGVPAALIVAGAALGAAKAPRRSGPVLAAVALGDASYALYLVHPFAIRGLHAVVERLGLAPVLGGWGFVALALAAATAVAMVVHVAFERPLLRALYRTRP